MEKEVMDDNISGEKGQKMVYEASYLILPTVSTDEVLQKVANIKEVLVSFGGALISDENPVLIDLAYPMVKVIQTSRQKATQGYFGWVKFEIEGSDISNVKKFFDNDSHILRYLIIKTVKENTLLNGKMKLKSEDKSRKVEEREDGIDSEVVKEEIVTEELDKSIDDLVVA